MDELTFLSGCVLAGLFASPEDLFDEETTNTMIRMRALAVQHLNRIASQAEERQREREERLREAVEVSERDALSELSSIIEAVDVAGGWPTPEAKADADVVAWVRDVAVERDRLKQLYHNKCIDAAQDAAENEVLKSRNAALRAQQVRLLAALERARLLVQGCSNQQATIVYGGGPWAELVELIDLLKLECKPDEEPHG